MRPLVRLIACITLALAAQNGVSQSPAKPATAQPPVPHPTAHAATLASGPEAGAARAYQTAALNGPLALRAFLADFPKGADLHVHLSGAVYAESFIRAAGEDGLCVDPVALRFVKPLGAASHNAPACKQGDVAAASVPQDQKLYDA